MRLAIDTTSAEETGHFGTVLGELAAPHDVIGISGDLGAGKTQLVRGLARGLDIDPALIYSPSFTLVAEHEGRLRLHHIDLFRLDEPVSASDEEEIGLAEYLESAGITAVEWHRKLRRPPTAWTAEIDIEVGEGNRRTIVLSSSSMRGERLLGELQRRWR
jgi:tRNA threonylcarbamoyladenosine biosynthesis protein TsaE